MMCSAHRSDCVCVVFWLTLPLPAAHRRAASTKGNICEFHLVAL